MEHLVFDPMQQQAQGDRVLFHYTTSGGLAGILDSGRFRLSSMRAMNDPRESLDFRAIGGGGKVANRILKDQVHLVALTFEDESAEPEGWFARGFARARNWAQYGDAHRGAVLAFNKERLLGVVEEELPGVQYGRMEYRDTAVWDSGGIDDSWIVKRQTGEDEGDYAKRLLREHWRDLYLVKNRDWESEREFRLLYWGAERPEFPIARCLEGIVLGHDFPAQEESVIATRLYRLGVERIRVHKLEWVDGAPYGNPPTLRGLHAEQDPTSPYYNPDSPLFRPLPDGPP